MEWNKVMTDMHLLNFLRDSIEIKMCKWAMKQRKGHVNSTGSKSNIKKNSYFHTKTTYELPFRTSKYV